MAVEIERRFLVRVAEWAAVDATAATRERILQFYLSAERSPTVRVRITGDSAVLTVKGAPVGDARAEVEAPIDLAAARTMLEEGLYVGTPVEKTRSTLHLDGLTWQVDQFEGDNAGLIIAEVELDGNVRERANWDARVSSARLQWLGREITGDVRFANSRLAVRPFTQWPPDERDAVLREIEGG